MQVSGDFRSGPPPIKQSFQVNAKLIVGAAIAIALLILGVMSTATVPAGHRGVRTIFGSVEEVVLEEGIHFMNPFAVVSDVNVQTQLFVDSAAASSDDLQSVSTTVEVNYHAMPEFAYWHYQTIGQEAHIWEAKILRPIVQESVKAITAEFTAENLIKRRPEVKAKITDMIRERMLISKFNVEQVSITDFKFSAAFDDAIEAKVRAEQEAQKAKNDLERVKFEQEQKVVIAEANAREVEIQAGAEAKRINQIADAEANAHKVIAAAVTPESLKSRTIEKWDGVLPKVVGSGSGLLLQLGLEDEKKSSR